MEKGKAMPDSSLYRRAGASMLCAAAFLSLLLRSEAVAASVSLTLVRCATSLLPVLFPSMCVCGAFVNCGGAESLGRLLEGPARRLFGINGSAMTAVICGFLCGYPVGAKCTADLVKRGAVGKSDATRLICAAGIASPGYLFGISASMWRNKALGAAIYITLGATSLLYLILTRKRALSATVVAIGKSDGVRFTSAVTSAVRDASVNCLYITGFIVFYGALCDLLMPLLISATASLKSGAIICAVAAAAFEFSRGVSMAGAIVPASAGASIAGFAAAFGGLSIMSQTAAVIPTELSGVFKLKKYAAFKLIQGAAAALCAGLCVESGFISVPTATEAAAVEASAGLFAPSALLPLVLTLAGCLLVKMKK